MIIFSFSSEKDESFNVQWSGVMCARLLWNMIFTFCSSYIFFPPWLCICFVVPLSFCERGEQRRGKKGWHIRMSLSLFTETWITIRWCILAGCSSCCVHHSAVISQLALAFFFLAPSLRVHSCQYLFFLFDLKIRRVTSWNISITKHHFHLALNCFCSITSQTNKNEDEKKRDKIEKKWSERQYILQKSN